MSVSVMFSPKDLHRLHCLSNPIEVNFIGGIYRARTRGSSIVAFGDAPSELPERLHTLQVMKSYCAVKQCDRDADRAEQAAERFAAKVV